MRISPEDKKYLGRYVPHPSYENELAYYLPCLSANQLIYFLGKKVVMTWTKEP